ncbi:MAG: metal ABC transporter permease [Armatimonadota bacterium]|nr:metal ABC transporter permease [Armatimonadota bacterium]
MSEILTVPFLRVALTGGLIVGCLCAFLGVHVVLRRIVFVGAALAQVSSAGVALALCTGANPASLSLALTLGGVAAFSVRSSSRRVTQESIIGVAYASASALAVLFVAKSAHAEAHLLNVLSGNILTITPGQVWLMAILLAMTLLVYALFQKQFLFSAFDPETARASGIRASLWDLLFYIILGVAISFSIRVVGTLLVFAFLVVPAVTALLLSQRFAGIYALAVGSAAISTVSGLVLSYKLDLPTGPTIVAFSAVLLLAAYAASRLMS